MKSFWIAHPACQAAIATQLGQSRGILPIALVFIPLEKLCACPNFCGLRRPHATKAPEETSKPIDEDLFKGSFRSAVVVKCLEQCVEIGLRFALQHNIGKNSVRYRIALTTLLALLRSRTRRPTDTRRSTHSDLLGLFLIISAAFFDHAFPRSRVTTAVLSDLRVCSEKGEKLTREPKIE